MEHQKKIHFNLDIDKRELQLTIPAIFSFFETLEYLSRSPKECMHHVENNKIYKLLALKGKKLLIEISCDQQDVLLLRLLETVVTDTSNSVALNPETDPLNSDDDLNSDDKEMYQAVADYVIEWFDLVTDLDPFYKMANNDILLQKTVNQFYGLRHVGIPNLFEALCWGIIGQQINLPFAFTLKQRFVQSFGQSVAWMGREYWLFPAPYDIANLSVSDLSGLQMSAKKSEYLIGVAQLVATEKLSKELLLEAGSFKAAEKQLVAIRGIGPWTANYVLMQCLRMPSAFPIDDVGLHNAIKHLMGLDHKPSIDEIRRLSAAWTNWESYATIYLWRSLN